MAWASSFISAVGHDASQADDNGQPSPLQQNDSCDDHCAHSSAHVVALISAATTLRPEPRSAVFYFYQRIPGSRTPAPPFQPPIS
ncbi:MAG: hypothetical protein ACE5FQ_10720 [Thiogranum sp.]